MPDQLAASYYGLLGLMPSASTQQIRRAYRELSKLYHPDTTALPAPIATAKFQQLNEAYATLSSPEQRLAYDLKIGYSRFSVIQAPANFDRPVSKNRYRSTAYLDPSDRPLSGGELFALFILGLTFVACLALVVTIGLTRGEIAFHSPSASATVPASSVPANSVPDNSLPSSDVYPLQVPDAMEPRSQKTMSPDAQPTSEANPLKPMDDLT